MQHELELLTKELRQVNLQQFIKQTGTKVTVLPAEPGEEENNSSSQRKGSFSSALITKGRDSIKLKTQSAPRFIMF